MLWNSKKEIHTLKMLRIWVNNILNNNIFLSRYKVDQVEKEGPPDFRLNISDNSDKDKSRNHKKIIITSG